MAVQKCSPVTAAAVTAWSVFPPALKVNIHVITHAPASDVFASDVYAQHAQCASAIAAAFTQSDFSLRPAT